MTANFNQVVANVYHVTANVYLLAAIWRLRRDFLSSLVVQYDVFIMFDKLDKFLFWVLMLFFSHSSILFWDNPLMGFHFLWSHSASESPYKKIFRSLPKPGGGEFGKYYSLPALNDPRIGMCLQILTWILNYSQYIIRTIMVRLDSGLHWCTASKMIQLEHDNLEHLLCCFPIF